MLTGALEGLAAFVSDHISKENVLMQDVSALHDLIYIEPFNARDVDIFNLQPNENSAALKFISKGKVFNAAYLNEKLAPMYPGKKSIPKKTYKSLLESLESGLVEVQRQVTEGELFLEDMLTNVYMK